MIGMGNWILVLIFEENNWMKNMGVIKVLKGMYFVLGDYCLVFNDSCYWGFVLKNKIVGVVKVGFWFLSIKQYKYNVNQFWKYYFMGNQLKR